jgi:hypothetical protein
MDPGERCRELRDDLVPAAGSFAVDALENEASGVEMAWPRRWDSGRLEHLQESELVRSDPRVGVQVDGAMTAEDDPLPLAICSLELERGHPCGDAAFELPAPDEPASGLDGTRQGLELLPVIRTQGHRATRYRRSLAIATMQIDAR